MSSKGRKKGTNLPMRIDKDNYPTPLATLKVLFDRLDLSNVKSFLEPCAGDNRILKLIPDNITKHWCEIRRKKDYFKSSFKDIDLIVTNPPFSLSERFLKKSLEEGKTVCYLQRINWLGSQKRKPFWDKNLPNKMLILQDRPKFMKELGLNGGTDSTEYAWYIWDALDIVNLDPDISKNVKMQIV